MWRVKCYKYFWKTQRIEHTKVQWEIKIESSKQKIGKEYRVENDILKKFWVES